MDNWLYFVLIGLFELYCGVEMLAVTHIEVPEYADFRDRVTVSCNYHMGRHKLNSVKWYKDEKEFFRYSPMMNPIFLQFPVVGVSVTNDKHFCNEITCSISLSQLTKKSSGSYRCEVSGDAPEFKLTTRMSNMTVAALPQHDPLINGVNLSYRMDEYVVANCSSDWSFPPASLSWYINNEKALSEMLQPQQETTTAINDYNLKLRSLEIRFYLNSFIFMNAKGILNMKCIAEIDQMPSLRRETTVTSYILFTDDLINQKLINSGSGGRNMYCCIFNSAITIMLLLIINKFSNNV